MSEKRRGGAWTEAARNDEVACVRGGGRRRHQRRVRANRGIMSVVISAAPERIEGL